MWIAPLLIVGGLIAWGEAVAVTGKKPAASPPSTSRQVTVTPEPRRSRLPVVTVESAGVGQAGYVHYFLITHLDGTLEYQVGIELEDQRIAWSFPGLGVAVSPFIKAGALTANGVEYPVEHLYGIRPFPNDAAMHELRAALTHRVARWIDDEVPYCVYRTRDGPFCLSCGDFVVRILFPGRTHLSPALPRDFFRGPPGSGSAPSTDDLLLYLAGLNELTSREARLQRIAELALPQSLREDLVDLLTAPDAEPTPVIASAPRPVPRKLRPGARPSQKVVQEPPPPRKKL